MADSLVTEWAEMPLDSRILEALKSLKWTRPTTVQSACVLLALKGKDISIQSRTGSGKTGAVTIPLVQRIISERERHGKKSSASANPVALILVPSVELCEQTAEAIHEIAKYVKPRIVVENLTSGGAITASRITSSHVVVSTAALLAKSCRNGAVTRETMKSLRYFVMDEADMIVSMAELSLRTVQSVLPSSMQVVLCSATLTEGVASIKGQLLHNPTNIALTDEDVDNTEVANNESNDPIVESHITLKDPSRSTLHQHYLVATDECHRHTLLYGLYRLALIKGKTLIFVNEEEDTYRLQHFLEQLGVATLVYDANLPLNVRLDTLRRFQSGTALTLVCTDGTLESVQQLQMSLEGGDNEEVMPKSKRRRRGNGNDGEAPSALHRGIDFSQVRNVILFDGVDATSSIALSRYTHRIGRAGRAGEEGIAITFFTVPQAKKSIYPLRCYCESKGAKLTPFRQMQRSEAARLQYRVDSAMANITRASTRKLRVATVAAELSRSSYLANHMTQRDTDALQRVVSRSSKAVKIERNLLEIPSYMRLDGVEEAGDYTRRVRADQTRATKFAKVAKKTSADPLKAVVSKLRTVRRKTK